MNVAKPYACSLCDRAFARKYDLRRHEQNLHTEDEDSEVEDSQSQVDVSESEGEDDSSGAEMSSDELEDNPAYLEWYERAVESTREMRGEKYEKYIAEGMDDELAKEKANMKILWAVKRYFFESYETFLALGIHLKDDDTHQEIMDDIEEKIDNGVSEGKAIKRVIAKHRAKFEGIFQREEDEEMEDTEDSDD
jgi:hypothetical protein